MAEFDKKIFQSQISVVHKGEWEGGGECSQLELIQALLEYGIYGQFITLILNPTINPRWQPGIL